MILVLDDLLDAATLGVLQQVAGSLDFEDGRATAGHQARKVKQNEQAADTDARAALLARVAAALNGNLLFQSAARPRALGQMLVSRYGPGQTYGRHVDDALMGGQRSDLSFTLFLSDPDSYAGGALVIEDHLEQRHIRLNAGEMVLYPSNTLHHVSPVTEGTRLAVVGWVTSLLRGPAQREILFDLDQAIARAEAEGASAEHLLPLLKTRSNLLRMWAE